MRWVRRVFTGLSTLVIAALCGAWLLFSVPSTGWQTLAIPTGSMRPALPIGSLVLVHRVPTRSLRVGDVITYANPLKPDQTITHRIVKAYKIDDRIPAFITKGDANPVADVPVAGGAVQGKMVWHLPFAGTALGLARTWPGIITLLYVPALLITVDEVKRLAKYYKENEPYRLPGFVARNLGGGEISLRPVALSVGLVAVFALVGVTARPVLALLQSNSVALTHNTLSVCKADKDDDDIAVDNATRQAAHSSSTNGPNANSGDASDSNKTNVKVKIKPCQPDKDHGDDGKD